MKTAKNIPVLAGAALMALAANAPASAQGLMTMAVPDWTGAAVTCQVLAHVLENEMGYKVKHVTIPSGAPVMEAIKGGDIDLGCELWPSYNPTKGKYFKEWGGDGSIVTLGESGIVGKSSYYVPRYLVEGPDAKAPDLKKFADLGKYVDLFKTLESGDKGRVLGCPTPAWECDDQGRLDAYGLNFHAVELGSETAHWAEMQGLFKRGEPFVAYAWEPHWIHAELDLVALELDPYGDGSAWPKSGWAVDVTVNYGRGDIMETDPKVAQMITNSNMPNDVQAKLILAVDVEGKDMEDVVEAWMAENETTWKAWLPK